MFDCAEDGPLKRLLLLSYFYPPSSEVAAKPTARLVRHLASVGWEAVVIAAQSTEYLHSDPVAYSDVLKESRVERVRAWPHPTDILAHAKLRLRRLRGHPIDRFGLNKENEASAATRGGASGLRFFLRSALCFPDRYTGWIVPAARRAAALLRGERFDAVLSVSPAPSAHLAALLLLRQHPHLPWIAQFHDPWTADSYRRQPDSLLRLARFLEGRVVGRSQAVAFATEEAARWCEAQYGEAKRVFVLHNGFDPADFAGLNEGARSDSRLTFTYAGSLYGKRDPAPFLEALARVLREGHLQRAGVRVRFIGDCAVANGRPLDRVVESLGLAGVVEISPAVPYPDALRALLESDVLLIFAEDQPLQIPAKLFDYLPLGRTILALADGASARLVQSTGGVVASSADPGSIERALTDLARTHTSDPKPRPVPHDRIDCYRADRLAAVLARELDSAVAGCRRPISPASG